MSRFLLSLFALVVTLPVWAHGDADCCAQPTITTIAVGTADHADPGPQGHPLKGVVIDILATRGAILVKHEDVPGVMKAMTMLFKVDATTLTTVKKGQAITGSLVQKTDGWWLENVRPVAG